MKVTVCFDSVRVVVPCGDGDFTVKDLIAKAIIRYRKATGKPSDSWVTVHNLRQCDGGILDPDDVLLDVADDREQIIAIYDEANKPQQGDGTSASDESEHQSPDLFKNGDPKLEGYSRNDIEITGEALNGTPPPLHVRRGSEPALNRLSPIPCFTSVPPDPSKRWSAAPLIDDNPDMPSSSTPLKEKTNGAFQHESHFDGYPGERGEGSGEEKKPSSASSSASSHHSATTTTLSRFSRDGNRCSVQILSDNPSMTRWAEAADRVLQGGGLMSAFHPPSEGIRREPLGGAATTPQHSRDPSYEEKSSRPVSRTESHFPTTFVSLVNDGSPLGIHVIPSTDRTGQDEGLLVEGIEPDGRVARDGRIKVHDVIIEINKKSLRNVTFHQAQEIFKDAMMDPELQLVLFKKGDYSRESNFNNGLIYPGQERGSKRSSIRNVAPTSLSSRTQSVMLQSNTRRLGKRLVINLIKGSHGLGFSVTTRDNPAGGEAPIYIKNILPKGAAIDDGNLRIGDRLLEINGIEVTGYSQSDVVGLLRQIPVGGRATLSVSRHEKVNDMRAAETKSANSDPEHESPKLPRQMTDKTCEDSLNFPWKQREILTFEIPVHDSERAGLGVSVKGKTSNGTNGTVDLGIFVKNVIHGGAASRDGRLKQNDQLVNINGLSLLGKPNSDAMTTLRTAMHQEGPSPGMITLTVARRLDGLSYPISRSGRDSVNSLGTSSSGIETFPVTTNSVSPTTPDHSGTSDASDSTVIFNGRRDIPMEVDVGGFMESLGMNNPVIQRITGNSAGLRNESYYKATHDTFNSSQYPSVLCEKEHFRPESMPPPSFNVFGSPTVNLLPRDTVIIHDEYDIPSNSTRHTNCAVGDRVPPHPSFNDQQTNDAYVSQSSLEETGPGFSRDQFGRQSMSEKRHATLDAKNTDTYQRTKKAREDREQQKKQDNKDSNKHDYKQKSSSSVGPSLGMRKSSSLESLQTMVQEIALEEEGQRSGGSGKVPRGRGCNDSFRAAVDRSYDAPLSNLGVQMETLAEEESESSGSGFGRGNSRQSSVNSAEEKLRKSKKKAGIFKGLGSMFRFGKHRKSLDGPINFRVEDLKNEMRTEASRRLSQDEMDHDQDQFWKGTNNDKAFEDISSAKFNEDEGAGSSRSVRMHQLRAEHQRRHAQRNRTYPTDDIEEEYDQALKHRLEPNPPEPKAEIQHIRSQSYDVYGGPNRPGSRGPYSEAHKFSHYVNYEQIQMHLRNHREQERLAKLASRQYQDFREKQTSREQREYQSQRSSREHTSHHQRPVSNYFEYESVQAIISSCQDNRTSTSSLPRRHHQQPPPPSNSSGNKRSGPPPPPGSQHPNQMVAPSAYKAMQKGTQPSLSVSGRLKPQPRSAPHIQSSRGAMLPSNRINERECVYASSGYRPASHYPTHHHNMPNARHTTLTVPGSKV